MIGLLQSSMMVAVVMLCQQIEGDEEIAKELQNGDKPDS